MVVSNSQNRKADVVQRHTYEATREANNVANSRWAVDPGLLHAGPGDTVKWTVHDSSQRQIQVHDISQELFLPDSLCQEGNTFRATINPNAESGKYYEYRFFYGNDEAHGGSAPGVIID
jgi:plastocyanin